MEINKSKKPPKALEELIEIVNLVSPNVILPTEEQMNLLFEKKVSDESITFENDTERFFEKLKFLDETMLEAISDYPQLKEFVLSEGEPLSYYEPKTELLFHPKYRFFLNHRHLLKVLAQEAMRYSKAEAEYASSKIKDEFKPFGYIPVGSNLLQISMPVIGIENGEFYFILNSFISALKGVKANRLRVCPICDRVFWAYRLSSYGCSKQHSTAIRTREYRERKKEETERLNTHFQSRKKNNGTL